jgi:hypothetical protein
MIERNEKKISSFVSFLDNFELTTNYREIYSDDKDKFYSGFSVNLANNDTFYKLGMEKIGFDDDFNLVVGKYKTKNLYYFGGILESKAGFGVGGIFNNLNLEFYNTDVNDGVFNLKFKYDFDKIKLGVKYKDIFEDKNFEFFIDKEI